MTGLIRPTDRRSEIRRSSGFPCQINPEETGPPFAGKVVNISEGGMLIEADACLLVGASVSILIDAGSPHHSFRVSGHIVAMMENAPSCRYSIQIYEVLGGVDKQMVSFFSRLNGDSSLVDRRGGTSGSFFPIRRRSTDNLMQRYLENPYDRLCRSLAEMPGRDNLRTVVLSPALDFLGRRIRRVLEKPRLITTDELDEGVGEGVLLVVNIDCRRRHEPYTFFEFEDLVRQRRRARPEPLFSLTALSRCLAPGQTIAIASLAPLMDRKLIQKFMAVAKLVDCEFISDHVVTVRKRAPLEKKVFGGQFLLEEIESYQGIEEIHAFSKDLYGKTNNYDEEVDSLFALQSDYYRVTGLPSGRVITCGRVSWHLPGFPLPMMLAVRPGSEDHIYLTDPDHISYGEVYAPYMLSVTTGKVYGELIRTVYDYCARGAMDYILTTYQATQSREFRFLSRCVGFKDTGVVLRYGNFGGNWSVVYASKNMFDANWNISFASPGAVPTMFKEFQR